MNNDEKQELQRQYFKILGALRDEETDKEEVNGDYVALVDSITCDNFVDKLFIFDDTEDNVVLKNFELKLIDRNKNHWFVEHLNNHLEKGELSLNSIRISKEDNQLFCNVCDKNITKIAHDTYKDIKKEIAKAVGK